MHMPLGFEVPRSALTLTRSRPGDFSENPARPNELDALIIEAEVRRSAAAMGGKRLLDNSISGSSPS
jgi:hypothetical protein